jgi:hypothetical protein
MERVWSRRQLEDRVNVLRERYDGEDFAAAVAGLAAELGPEEQEDLREIILARVQKHSSGNPALEDRFERGGWLRRTFGSSERALQRERFERRKRR